MPPHRGHLALVDFARHYTDDLTVVVGSLVSEPIPGELRTRWMRELFPTVRVVHLTDENPQYPEEHPDFWAIWKTSLERIAERPVDLLFASEIYGETLAQTLGAKFVLTPGARSAIPISASMIRENPAQYWEYLPRVVRPYFQRRVACLGTLEQARQLATERGATLLEPFLRGTLEDQARGQLAMEKSRLDSPELICHRGLVALALEAGDGPEAGFIRTLLQEHPYHEVWTSQDTNLPPFLRLTQTKRF